MLCVGWLLVFFFFFKQKTAYEMRISDWSSDVCSSDLLNVDVGVGYQIAFECAGQEFVHGSRVGIDAYAPFDAAGKFMHVATQVFQLAQHDSSVLDQCFTRWREADPLAGSIQQLRA